VPVVIGKNGWEKVVDFKLNSTEKALFDKSAEAVRATNDVLNAVL
jgi:malate dehydrogenase